MGSSTQRRPGVLFVAPQIPFPLDTGGKIRTFYQLKALAERFEVDLLALGHDIGAEGDDPLWRGIEASLREVWCIPRDGIDRKGALLSAARSLLGTLPYPVEKYRSSKAGALIAEKTRGGRYEVVHFDSLHTFRLVDRVAPHARLVLDEHNVEALILERMAEVSEPWWKRRLVEDQAARTDTFERLSALRAHRVLLCSSEDLDLLAERTGRRAGFEVIPNGVDLTRFDPEGEGGRIESEEPYAMFLGSMDWWPNADGVSWFVKEIWPRIRRLHPALGLKVVGRNPAAELRALGGQEGIEITGGVPDVRPYMRGCSAFVVPLRVGGGTRLKILEAMAIGAPIVSTSIGCEGIEAQAGRDLLVEDSVAGFAAAVSALSQAPERRAELSAGGRQVVEGLYSWEAIGRRLVGVYEALIEGGR